MPRDHEYSLKGLLPPPDDRPACRAETEGIALADNLTRAGRVLRMPLRLIPRRTHVRVISGPLRGRRWIAGSSTHGCWIGTVERGKLEIFSSAVRGGDVVYDLGAHVGLYALLASDLVGPQGRVYAFEPLPRNIRYLLKHLQMNHVGNCTVVEAAVNDADGYESFDLGPHPAMGFLGSPCGEAMRVRTVTIDALVRTGRIQPPMVVKVDIEGAEFDALCGASDVLGEHRPIVFLATHGPELHRRCCELLVSLGYSLRSLNRLPIATTSELVALPLDDGR
jgi:FkbM family methyltransferase